MKISFKVQKLGSNYILNPIIYGLMNEALMKSRDFQTNWLRTAVYRSMGDSEMLSK